MSWSFVIINVHRPNIVQLVWLPRQFGPDWNNIDNVTKLVLTSFLIHNRWRMYCIIGWHLCHFVNKNIILDYMYFLGILEQCAYCNTFCFLYSDNCVKLPNNCNVSTRHRRTSRLSNVYICWHSYVVLHLIKPFYVHTKMSDKVLNSCLIIDFIKSVC